ncbi:N-acetyltransferase [Opitutaceae bacterium EW11]|nr:N-acetyltransferase [Opitutaceae bacterium EW11]
MNRPSPCQCGSPTAAPCACSCGARGGANGGIHLRAATVEDIPLLCALINDLAEYEQLEHECVSTPEQIAELLFGPAPRVFAELAHTRGEAVGFAVWYFTASTFAGTPGLFIEDLYVRPAFRRRGIGRRMLSHLAGKARAFGCRRVEWRALKANAPALRFYEGLSAVPLVDWTTFRLDGAAMDAIAAIPR